MAPSDATWYLVAAADRLEALVGDFQIAACVELGLPVSHVRQQILFAVRSIRSLAAQQPDRAKTGRAAAFLFPGNTEGALPAYLIAVAVAFGLDVEAKLSRRQREIGTLLADVFRQCPGVRFHDGAGRQFLERVLADHRVGFVQVFGDDGWIEPYRQGAARRPLTFAFEGPGKDPLIVLPGSDVTTAVDLAVESGLFAGGAACMSAERFIVHEDLAPAFTEALVDRLTGIRPTDPSDPDAVLGWHASEDAVVRIRSHVEDALSRGARLRLPGRIVPVERDGRTLYACEPIVLTDVEIGAPIWREETFGPVFPVHTFREDGEAAALAEDAEYGLSATVLGDPETAGQVSARLRRSHALVFTNESMVETFRPDFWGSGGFKRSGWIEETVGGRRRRRDGFRSLRSELAHFTAVREEATS